MFCKIASSSKFYYYVLELIDSLLDGHVLHHYSFKICTKKNIMNIIETRGEREMEKFCLKSI